MRALARELQRPVAAHASRAPFALGLAALLLLALVALSGVPLALLYEAARVPELLASGAPALLRAVHAWGASLLLALALVHLVRAALTAAYRGPRARTWNLGLAALALLLAMFWSGVVLRGDQQALEAWRHGARTLAFLGLALDPQAVPAGAVFWAHVLALPALLLGLVGAHVLRVRRLDLAPLGPAEAKAPFAAHLRTGAALAAALAGLALLLALALPPALGPAPLPHLEAARAPWPFAWLVPLQDALGSPAGIVVGLALLFGGLALLPRLDARGATLRERAAPLALLALLLGLVVLLGLAALLGPGAVRIVG